MDDEVKNEISNPRDNFNIMFGDTTEIMSEIKETSGYKNVMSKERKDGWGFYKTDIGFYWIIEDDKLKNKLGHQFMIIPSKVKVYIFFHFRQKEAISYIKKLYQMIEDDLKNSSKQYIFIGLDFTDLKFQRVIKKDLIKWCLQIEGIQGDGYCQYFDLHEFDIKW